MQEDDGIGGVLLMLFGAVAVGMAVVAYVYIAIGIVNAIDKGFECQRNNTCYQEKE